MIADMTDAVLRVPEHTDAAFGAALLAAHADGAFDTLAMAAEAGYRTRAEFSPTNKHTLVMLRHTKFTEPRLSNSTGKRARNINEHE